VRPGEADDFFIECVRADPATAARVPNLLADLLVEEAERERPEGAGTDRKALEARLAGARQAMEEAEAAIVRFRAQARHASEAIPTLERLAREYGEARKAYLEIEEQWNAAEAASRIGERARVRFTVLRPASPPSAPLFPNRVLFALVGAALGLAAGLGWAVLAELRDRSVKGPEDLAEALPFPILAEVPLVQVRRPGRRVPTRGGSGRA
jgi:polysaccharide biosynthesis transport protein